MMFLYSQSACWHRIFSFFITLLLFSIVAATSSQAQIAADPFVVEGVEVDITADNAVEAREQAFEAAQVKAYEKLASSLLSAEEMTGFEIPDINHISGLVKSFEVTNEKLSAVRYNAIYTIRFREHSLGSHMMAADKSDMINPRERPDISPDILILPVVQRDGRNYLWSTGPYRQAWDMAIQNDESGRYILPLGNMADQMAIRDDEIFRYDFARVSEMMRRYQVKNAVIVITNPQAGSVPTNRANLSLYLVTPSGPKLIKTMQVPVYPGELPTDLFPRAVAQSTMVMNNHYWGTPVQQQLPTQAGPSNVFTPSASNAASNNLVATVAFSSVRDWLETKKTLERTRGITGINVQSMSARTAIVEIAYNGTPQSLTTELQAMRMNLIPAYTNGYNAASYRIVKM